MACCVHLEKLKNFVINITDNSKYSGLSLNQISNTKACLKHCHNQILVFECGNMDIAMRTAGLSLYKFKILEVIFTNVILPDL
jgi:hypothetical protein